MWDTDHVPHPSIPKHMRTVTQNWKKKMKKNTKKLNELSLLQEMKQQSIFLSKLQCKNEPMAYTEYPFLNFIFK